MEIIGIIAEYNPFHNGHLYHIEKIKEKYPESLIVLVLNGYFSERGDLSLQSKEAKTAIALNHHVDLVVELPVLYGTQSADIFANAAIKILNEFQVNRIIIGSETNDSEQLMNIAKMQLTTEFDEKIKEYIATGINYPTALAKALNQDFEYKPNDLLGISYAKAIIKNNYDISLETIKRTNDFHDNNLDTDIVSASNIRLRLNNNENIEKYVPKDSLDKISYINNTLVFNFVKYHIIMSKELDQYLDVTEGIDYVLKENISKVKTLSELIQKTKSKRYTYNRINRLLIHILLGITKKDAVAPLAYIKILGFNAVGKKYLNSIKKEISIPLKKDFNSVQYKVENKSALIYEMITNQNVLDFESKNKPIIKY